MISLCLAVTDLPFSMWRGACKERAGESLFEGPHWAPTPFLHALARAPLALAGGGAHGWSTAIGSVRCSIGERWSVRSEDQAEVLHVKLPTPTPPCRGTHAKLTISSASSVGCLLSERAERGRHSGWWHREYSTQASSSTSSKMSDHLLWSRRYRPPTSCKAELRCRSCTHQRPCRVHRAVVTIVAYRLEPCPHAGF